MRARSLLVIEVSPLKSEVYSIPLTFFKNQFICLDVAMNDFDMSARSANLLGVGQLEDGAAYAWLCFEFAARVRGRD